MAWLRRQLVRLAAFAETRGGAIAVFVAALAVWWIQAIAMPLARGRDFGTYVGAFIEPCQVADYQPCGHRPRPRAADRRLRGWGYPHPRTPGACMVPRSRSRQPETH